MHSVLSPSQLQLLHHLVIAEIPSPDAIAAAVRGLDQESSADDVQTLSWMGLLEVKGEGLVITPRGKAAYFEAECTTLGERLIEVSAFADELQRRTPSLSPEMHALRQLAEGAWSGTEAVAYVERWAKEH
ncbi:hypothetical protein P3T37_006465 [Kitasatospora sp. MAA4]|uniref:hypothetical protein n=1 Tax=Kitasatospora sp. MAA4 TaxID=3035093 RepID=UPI00247552F4|nr:hypothetical protein [Kitasatospora sp. MAA4]MDH6137034.1 hypothetical protein [Kitasatospora sp. MAA4]